VAAGALVVVAGIAVRAEQGQGGGGRGGMVPMTASTIARNPAAHMGEVVSMMATVEAQLSKTVFTVDQDKAKTGQEVLVIAPTLQTPPEANAYVTIQGEVFKFDPAEVAKKARNYTLDLSPDLVAKYQGKPAVLATVVVTPALVDIAKRVLPPMTPEELAFRQNMLTIDGGAKALAAGLDAPNQAQLKETLANMKKAYTDVQAFFKARNTADAIKWAGESLQFVTDMEAALATGKLEVLKTGTTGVRGICAQCHGVHRERQDDGTFRIKSGG
jgi:mono/diheme cytochrome c family protein